jgi:uncharacterized protein YndB with AHSA1/START domain
MFLRLYSIASRAKERQCTVSASGDDNCHGAFECESVDRLLGASAAGPCRGIEPTAAKSTPDHADGVCVYSGMCLCAPILRCRRPREPLHFRTRNAGGVDFRNGATKEPGVKEYDTVSKIRATPEMVWRVLTDASGYANWNPEIIGIDGRMALNERITARVKLGSGAIRRVPMRVTAFEPPSRMEWTGGLPLGLFVGLRTFTVTPRDGMVEFRMHLRMSGPLAPLILKSVGDRQTEIDTFASAIRGHVEQGHQPTSTC